MHIHEIREALIRDHPGFRVYQSRQIEDMREAIPTYAAVASRSEAVAKIQADILASVTALLAELQAEKRFDVSDRLRAALKPRLQL